MTINDMIKKKPSSHHSSKLFRQSSFNDDTHKQHQKFKQLHTSVLDLLHWHRPKDSPEIKTIEDELPQRSDTRRPSIIKSSDMSKALSKKSVTFASVFDLKDDDQHYVVRIYKLHFIKNFSFCIRNTILKQIIKMK